MKPASPESPVVIPSAPKQGEYYLILRTPPVTPALGRWYVIRYMAPDEWSKGSFNAELLAYGREGTAIKSLSKEEYTFGACYTFLPITEQQASDPDFLNWIALCYG